MATQGDWLHARLPVAMHNLGGYVTLRGYNYYTKQYETESTRNKTPSETATYVSSGTGYWLGTGTVTVRAYPPAGYKFSKWTGYATSTKNPYEFTYGLSPSGRQYDPFTANFTIITYTVTFNANGGSSSTASATGTVNTPVILPSASRAGYSFSGWYDAASGGNRVGGSGDSYTPSGNVTFYAQWTPIPAHTISFSTSPSDIGTPATITIAPTRTEEGVDYYADTADVAIQPLAINGYRLDSVVFYDAAHIFIGSKTIADGDLSAFDLSSSDRNGRDVLLEFVYTQLGYSVGALVDGASEGKVTASVDQESAHWGDTVTFTATDIAEGYSFAGWFDADGVQQSSEVAYEVTVQGDIALYAKCKVQCSLSLQYDAEEGDDTTSCSLTVDGAEYVPSTQFPVTLGESFAYVLSLGLRTQDENWCLDRWTDSGGELQMYGTQGTVTPTAPLALVAHLVSVEDSTKTLVVNTGAPSGSSFERAVPYRRTGSEGAYEWEAANPYTFAGNIPPATAQHGGPSLMDTPPPGQFSRDFAGGVQYVRISAEPQVWYEDEESETGYSEQSFRGFYDAEGTLISAETTCYLLMAEDREIWAVYGSAMSVRLNIGYADADSANRGNIAIMALTDEGGTIDEDRQGAAITQGYVATLRAVPKNGYRFVGWYDDTFTAGDPISANAELEYTVMAAKTIYAKFAPSRDKICRWEGSSDNMTMEWTSKVYVSTRPFDPVAARVDAAGYPVDLTVRTYSSPDKVDALPVRDHELTRENPLRVESQDGRRLPRMRPERYVQISVKAEHEVDAVIVGTNMAEVN